MMARVQIVALKHIVGVHLGLIFDAEPFMRTFNAYDYSNALENSGVQMPSFNQFQPKKIGVIGDKIGDVFKPVKPKPSKPNDDSSNEETYPDEILDCEMSEWGEWSECYCDSHGDGPVRDKCLEYEQWRMRKIIQHPTIYQGKPIGKDCPDWRETRVCPPEDCVIEWSAWSEWSECSQVEGNDGVQERSRSGSITKEAKNAGKSCEEVYKTNDDDTFMAGSGQATHKQTRSCDYDTETTTSNGSSSASSSSTSINSNFFNTKKMSKGIGRVAVIGVLLGGSWWAYENRDTIGKTLKIDSPTTS